MLNEHELNQLQLQERYNNSRVNFYIEHHSLQELWLILHDQCDEALYDKIARIYERRVDKKSPKWIEEARAQQK